jgi:hypothetical protein
MNEFKFNHYKAGFSYSYYERQLTSATIFSVVIFDSVGCENSSSLVLLIESSLGDN